MNQNDVEKIRAGKIWFEKLIQDSAKFDLPDRFSFLRRRLGQIRCNHMTTQTTGIKRSRALVRYLLGIGYLSLTLLLSRFRRGQKVTGAFCIWDSDIDAHVSVEKFEAFLQTKQIIDLEEVKFLFVKSGKHRLTSPHSIYTPFPIYDVMNHVDLTVSTYLVFIAGQVRNLFRYLSVSAFNEDAAGIFKDFLLEPLIEFYKQAGLKKIYRTNSDFNHQEFWLENIDFNTVFYSTNSRTWQFKDMPFGSVPEYPLLHFTHFGTSWTWNDKSANWLKNFYDHPVRIVGPIMFYSGSGEKPDPGHRKRALIFDITPFNEKFMEKHYSANRYNYNSEALCSKFMEDILRTFEGRDDWEVGLKPKRPYTPDHSSSYVNLVSTAAEKMENFKVLPWGSNIFDEIAQADLVLTIPFSSPFYIAKSMEIPSYYYDPGGKIDFETMGYGPAEYFTRPEELNTIISKLR